MATAHVHATAANLYTGILALAVSAPRSALDSFSQTIASLLRATRAIWFLLWWLFLHRRLRPRQRGSRVRRLLSDCASLQRFLSKGRVSFLSETLERIFRLSLASLSASAWGVNRISSRLPFPSNVASPLRPPILSLVMLPVSITTEVSWVIRSSKI